MSALADSFAWLQLALFIGVLVAAAPLVGAGIARLVGDAALGKTSRRGADDLALTPVEFTLLAELLLHAGRLVTHRQLITAVWGPENPSGTRSGGGGGDAQYLRVYVHQLRRKLEPDPANPRRLLTEVGIGYRLVDGAG